METGIHNGMRYLRISGWSEELKQRMDKSCVAPHIHPRSERNDQRKPTTRRRRLYHDVWITERVDAKA